MSTTTTSKRQSHLEYYQQHGIAPVRYDLSSLDAHFDRRRSLYNKLGLPSLAFAGSNVLEVAAGTGHNSLFIAAQHPKTLVLLEPNQTAIDHIHAAYAGFEQPHTKPELITEKLEDFTPPERFDIVLCENWLGTSGHELGLLSKLASFLRLGGVLVVTTVSPIGFVPNLMRRYFACHLAPPSLSFDKRTDILASAYASHLSQLGAMTRNVTDWVQDNMINPAYFGLCLSSPAVLSHLGEPFEVLDAYPAFIEDWRWFKALHDNERAINKHFLSEYWRKCHNFLDTRHTPFVGDPATNQSLEQAAQALLKSIESSEDAVLHNGDVTHTTGVVADRFNEFLGLIPDVFADARVSLQQLAPLVREPGKVSPQTIAGLTEFAKLFGRETSYLALQRAV